MGSFCWSFCDVHWYCFAGGCRRIKRLFNDDHWTYYLRARACSSIYIRAPVPEVRLIPISRTAYAKPVITVKLRLRSNEDVMW